MKPHTIRDAIRHAIPGATRLAIPGALGDAMAGERLPGEALLRFVGHEHLGGLAQRDGLDEAREGGAGRGQVLQPEVGVARPGHPGGRVRGPLGGHPEAVFAGAHGRAV